jgi:Lar family restriction alleviation protein
LFFRGSCGAILVVGTPYSTQQIKCGIKTTAQLSDVVRHKFLKKGIYYMPAEELKSCPFCGSTSVSYSQSFAKSKTSIFYYHFYKCSNCGASSKGPDQFKALENWNRRADTMEAKIYSVQQLKAEIRAISDIIDVSEYGLITVDYACLKQRLRELSAV